MRTIQETISGIGLSGTSSCSRWLSTCRWCSPIGAVAIWSRRSTVLIRMRIGARSSWRRSASGCICGPCWRPGSYRIGIITLFDIYISCRLSIMPHNRFIPSFLPNKTLIKTINNDQSINKNESNENNQSTIHGSFTHRLCR